MGLSLGEIFEEQKQNVKVLILGPYGECKRQLEEMRDFLRSKGFQQAFIVEELPDINDIPREVEEIYFLAKSLYYIEHWGEILLFHFTTRGDCSSVYRELSFTADEVTHKCFFSTVIRSSDFHIGRLFEGTIRVNRINEYSYEEESQLSDLAFSSCFQSFLLLRKMHARAPS